MLTLILVALCDALFVPTAPPLTRSSLIGGGLIVGAFAGLIWGEYGAGKNQDDNEGVGKGKGMRRMNSADQEAEEEDDRDIGYEETSTTR